MSQEPAPQKTESEPINIKVVTSQGDEVFFKIKTNTKLTKLRSAYATKVGKDLNSIRFLYDGNRITDDDTPASLGMEDNDSIDVMVERFLLLGAASIVILALSINLQVARVSITSLGLQPALFNVTSAGAYDPVAGTVGIIGLYVAPIVTGAGIALSIISVLIVLPLFMTSFSAKRMSCATMVFLELIWTFLLALFWMAYAVIVTMGTVYAIMDSCQGNTLCLQVQVVKGTSIGVWVTVTAYFLTLLTLTSIGLSRGHKRAFVASTLTSDFFTRKAPQSSEVNDAPISPRVHFSRRCSETDAESVYSPPTPVVKPIPVHLNMTSSMSHDAHMVSGDWHEMKSVPIQSPCPRVFEKHFTLESDDGEVTDVPLDDDEDSKHRREDIKVKPLV